MAFNPNDLAKFLQGYLGEQDRQKTEKKVATLMKDKNYQVETQYDPLTRETKYNVKPVDEGERSLKNAQTEMLKYKMSPQYATQIQQKVKAMPIGAIVNALSDPFTSQQLERDDPVLHSALRNRMLLELQNQPGGQTNTPQQPGLQPSIPQPQGSAPQTTDKFKVGQTFNKSGRVYKYIGNNQWQAQ